MVRIILRNETLKTKKKKNSFTSRIRGVRCFFIFFFTLMYQSFRIKLPVFFCVRISIRA